MNNTDISSFRMNDLPNDVVSQVITYSDNADLPKIFWLSKKMHECCLVAFINREHNWSKCPNATKMAVTSLPQNIHAHTKLITELYYTDTLVAYQALEILLARGKYAEALEIIRTPVCVFPFEKSAVSWQVRVRVTNWLIVNKRFIEALETLAPVDQMHIPKGSCLRLLADECKKSGQIPSDEELSKIFPQETSESVFFKALLKPNRQFRPRGF